MEDLTFGEQVKIILGRKGMTIKQLAEMIEEKTGKKMSRQNLTQRLGRDNFQEQDMRMIAAILECPFQLSIMSVDAQAQPRSTASLERAAAARTGAVERMSEEEKAVLIRQEEPLMQESIAEPEADEDGTEQVAEPEQLQQEEKTAVSEAQPQEAVMETQDMAADERDVTIGELYEMHQELDKLEKNIEAGESVEQVAKELEKPKKDLFGGFFLRRKRNEDKAETKHQEPEVKEPEKTETDTESETVREEKEAPAVVEEVVQHEETIVNNGKSEDEVSYEEPEYYEMPVKTAAVDHSEQEGPVGEMNPYTGREYQSNSVRMHPTRIGYVQVYDRSIHKWTDMTEWAFLGLQERKKALLGNAYEPPIYLD